MVVLGMEEEQDIQLKYEFLVGGVGCRRRWLDGIDLSIKANSTDIHRHLVSSMMSYELL